MPGCALDRDEAGVLEEDIVLLPGVHVEAVGRRDGDAAYVARDLRHSWLRSVGVLLGYFRARGAHVVGQVCNLHISFMLDVKNETRNVMLWTVES